MKRLRFGIRTLLIGMTLAAIVAGLYTSSVKRQMKAVAELRRLGAQLRYFSDESVDEHSPIYKWAISTLGPDWISTVHFISFDKAADDALSVAAALSRTTTLHIGSGTITDDGMSQVGRFGNLQNLHLLNCPGITDKGVEKLAGLVSLKQVSLHSDKLTDRSMVLLASLPNLRCVSLIDGQITDLGLEPLRQSKLISLLQLNNTKVTDASIPVLLSIPNLWLLDLSGCTITDRSLSAFESISTLSYLGVDRTQVTPEALSHFQVARPNVKLTYWTSQPNSSKNRP